MARVIHRKYYGDVSEAGNTQFLIRDGHAWLPNQGAAVAGDGVAYIVRQKKGNRFLVSDGQNEGLCDLVNGLPTGPGQIAIPVDVEIGNDSVSATILDGGTDFGAGDTFTIDNTGTGGTGFAITVATISTGLATVVDSGAGTLTSTQADGNYPYTTTFCDADATISIDVTGGVISGTINITAIQNVFNDQINAVHGAGAVDINITLLGTGVINTINVTAGSGYNSLPSITGTSGAGTGESFNLLLTGGASIEYAAKVMLHRVRTFDNNNYKWTINEPSTALDVQKAYADSSNLKSAQINTQ